MRACAPVAAPFTRAGVAQSFILELGWGRHPVADSQDPLPR
jgi:hypothetical protein